MITIPSQKRHHSLLSHKKNFQNC